MIEWLANPVFTTWDSNTSLWSNTLITLYMTVGTMLFSTLIGVPLGLLLFETSGARGGLARHTYADRGADARQKRRRRRAQ